MRKTKRTLTSLMLATVLLVISAVPVLAFQDGSVLKDNARIMLSGSPKMSYIIYAKAGISLSGNYVTVTTDVEAYVGTTKCSALVRLQKNVGNSWVTIKTWYPSNNDDYLNFSDTYCITNGSYRVQSDVSAYVGSQSETYTVISGILIKK